MNCYVSKPGGNDFWVLVDHTLGVLHPVYAGDEPYLVNYANLNRTISDDQKTVDTYLPGQVQPVEVTAIRYRVIVTAD